MFSRFWQTVSRLVSREAFISLLFFISPISAHSYLEELVSFNKISQGKTTLFAESSSVNAQSSYQLLAQIKSTDSSGTEHRTSIDRFDIATDLTRVSNYGGVQFSLNYSRCTFETTRPTEKQGDMRISLEQPMTTALLSAWTSPSLPIAAGLTVGKAIGSTLTRDTSTTMTSLSPITTAYGIPLFLKGELRLNHRVLCGSLSLEQSPTAVAVPNLTMERSENFRTFPYSILKRSSIAAVGVHGEKRSLTVGSGIIRLEPSEYTTGENSLPLHLSVAYNETFFTGSFKALSSHVTYRQGKGALECYDSKSETNRFIRFETIPFNHLSGRVNLQKNSFGVELFGERFRASLSENGYIDFYPFSSWTLFRPYAYRYQNGTIAFQNGGISLEKKLTWNEKNQTEITLRTSYATASGSIDRAKKKIVVMIPMYVEDTTLTTGTQSFILGDITVNHRIQLRTSELALSARQLLPIPLHTSETTASTSTTSGKSHPDDRTYGGLTLSMTLSHPINRSRRTLPIP